MTACRKHFALKAKMEEALDAYINDFGAYSGDVGRSALGAWLIKRGAELVEEADGGMRAAGLLRMEADSYTIKWTEEFK